MSEGILVPIVTTVITTVGLIAVAYIGQWGARKAIRRRKTRQAAQSQTARELAQQEQADAALADYENNPGAFVARVLEDNKQKYAEIERLNEGFNDLRAELERLRDEVATLRHEDSLFRGALTRWLRDVFWSWGKTPEIPRPAPADAAILRPVLPWDAS